MSNVVKELLEHGGDKEVSFIKLVLSSCETEGVISFSGTLKEFLNYSPLDVEYDSGFGTQELFGYIWYVDGSWSEREEYEGSEWWCHKVKPEHSVVVNT